MLEADAELRAETAAGLLDANDAPRRVEANEPRANIERREVGHSAFAADPDLRRAAADVHVHDRHLAADRARRRAGAVRRHHRLQAVAGRDRDHLSGLPGKKLADLAGIAPAHGNAGEDQRAGVDLVGIDIGALVLSLDEGAERLRVDLFLGGIGREQDVGVVEGFARADDITAVEPLQHDAGEHEMRGGRADIDADAQDDDFVLVDERASRAGEEDTAAFVSHRATIASFRGPMTGSAREPGIHNHSMLHDCAA
jgi:hypothetical protein